MIFSFPQRHQTAAVLPFSFLQSQSSYKLIDPLRRPSGTLGVTVVNVGRRRQLTALCGFVGCLADF